MKYAEEVKKDCIHCGKCTKHCSFLEKYSMDLSGFAHRKDLAYHCFLCGACKRVCPKDLDGGTLSQEFREENPKGFGILKWQKVPYKFANNTKKNSKELLFFGCNFPGYYPKTTKELVDVFENQGIDFSIDCCGKPVHETGDMKTAKKSMEHIKELLGSKGVKRLICACPNCYHYLKDKVDVEVITIYEKLQELGIGKTIEEKADIFQPCPDKKEGEILKTLQPFLKDCELSYSDINCCGLGGLVRKQEPNLAEGFLKKLEEKETKNVYTYCATCSGSISKVTKKKVKHVLTEILEVREETNLSFAQNVITMSKYKKGR